MRGEDNVTARFLGVNVRAGYPVPLALRNRELAAGGAYLHSLKNGRTVNATIDVASFVVHISRSKIQLSSVSVGASYGF